MAGGGGRKGGAPPPRGGAAPPAPPAPPRGPPPPPPPPGGGAPPARRPSPAAFPVPAAGPSGFCSECGRPFSTDQLLNLGTASVCAQCKPVYLQRVREGGQAIGARRYAGFWIRFVA